MRLPGERVGCSNIQRRAKVIFHLDLTIKTQCECGCECECEWMWVSVWVWVKTQARTKHQQLRRRTSSKNITRYFFANEKHVSLAITVATTIICWNKVTTKILWSVNMSAMLLAIYGVLCPPKAPSLSKYLKYKSTQRLAGIYVGMGLWEGIEPHI